LSKACGDKVEVSLAASRFALAQGAVNLVEGYVVRENTRKEERGCQLEQSDGAWNRKHP
jgi:hypothetical protein